MAAALAPTDAALGVPVVTNPAVPSRVRRVITVESGLNDGIATPVVMVAIAGAASAEALPGAAGLGTALVELLVGAAIGAVVGSVGGWLLRSARRAHWASEEFAGLGVLALALLSYLASTSLDGNGFIAAFVGGLAFGATAGRRGPTELLFPEQASGLVSLLVWLAFGAVAVPIVLDNPDPTTVLYAVLSLTLVRMVPVALCCLGASLNRDTVLFIGWFGPRGLASLVFALLALEELGPAAHEAVAVIAVTVLLSLLAHGVTAGPLAARYGRRQRGISAAAQGESRRDPPMPDLPVRGLPRRTRSHPARDCALSRGGPRARRDPPQPGGAGPLGRSSRLKSLAEGAAERHFPCRAAGLDVEPAQRHPEDFRVVGWPGRRDRRAVIPSG